jgi:hypothetical protein
MTWGQLTINLTCVDSGGGSCDFATGGSPNADKGDSIRVSTTYAYSSFFSRLFGTTVNLGTQVQMVLEVPED